MHQSNYVKWYLWKLSKEPQADFQSKQIFEIVKYQIHDWILVSRGDPYWRLQTFSRCQCQRMINTCHQTNWSNKAYTYGEM
jgi:hypothetical protein